MDAEQIALGAFSPLRGFMNGAELDSVVASMRLPGGEIWPLPILLRCREGVVEGSRLVLTRCGVPFGVLEVDSCFERDWEALADAVYGSRDPRHPGVGAFVSAGPVAISGRVWVTHRVSRRGKALEMSPAQCRQVFEARGWSHVVGFHTRNAPHRAHEYIMEESLRRAHADGVLVHPAVGLKKAGDFSTAAIIAGFEGLLREWDLADRAVFGTFPTYSRYGGPREALFTAICRQNYGCSHFVVGRDHTGVGEFYAPDASQRIFGQFPELTIEPIFFGEVRFSRSGGSFGTSVSDGDALSVSGTESRRMLQAGERPPDWYMRPEVARSLLGIEGEIFVR